MRDDPLLPEPVARALAGYRSLRDEHGLTWGEPPLSYVVQARATVFLGPRHDYWGPALRQLAARHPRLPLAELVDRLGEVDVDRLVRDALAGEVPDNLPALRLTPSGAVVEAAGRVVLGDAPFRTALLLDSRRPDPAEVVVDGVRHEVPPGGAVIVEVAGSAEVTVAGRPVDLSPLARRAAPAALRLRAGFPCRWSVTGANGQGWYPEGAPPKMDAHGRPYFHGDDLVMAVPAEPLTVTVTRGMEYASAEAALTPEAGRETLVELTPERLYDAAGRGWYGGDLHVHLNWMGEEPAAPELAAAAQHGEDLHVLNLVAGNVAGARVYDDEALAHWAGRDLPWSDGRHLATIGVEYRNDLVGHATAFGLRAAPERRHSGFLGTADWPPNAVALERLRALGGVTGYGHPFHTAFAADAPPGAALGLGRDCSAREIVADAALGLVDTLDVLNHTSVTATAAVYRRLVGAGNRLAVSAGTDVVLSFCRRGTASAPPGWGRVYAHVGGPLTAAAYAEALLLGRTFATSGPWLELTVDGHGPGDTLELPAGRRVEIAVGSVGPEVERLEIRTADGVLAEGPPGQLVASMTVDRPTYVVAVATGGPHPRAMHPSGAYAHTSPVYLDVAGEHVAREADVRWCLTWLDRLEEILRESGTFESKEQLADHLELYGRARAVYRARLRT
ncbi:CehA/McbA family metallohydrolase [Actinomadura sp. ATCC 31491]|uniref:CehA/McbA family metallohydrolase n=1 Tax=Actinomadura luzonensis TaxID=2805427 RepID=A0ABT0FKI8_9ACTN|nr:CehA/McbA family metallohydrolase [Actinomadura luzonensis]MCK2212831.1 CehA/McbA family metallohydrolase [Actinomadura luzonensis]